MGHPVTSKPPTTEKRSALLSHGHPPGVWERGSRLSEKKHVFVASITGWTLGERASLLRIGKKWGGGGGQVEFGLQKRQCKLEHEAAFVGVSCSQNPRG